MVGSQAPGQLQDQALLALRQLPEELGQLSHQVAVAHVDLQSRAAYVWAPPPRPWPAVAATGHSP